MKQGTLVIVRHGESMLNLVNRFTGWLDVPLSVAGIKEANKCAKHCVKFYYDAAFTSNLERAHETLLIILSQQKKIGLIQHPKNKRYHEFKYITLKEKKSLMPIFTSEALNERAYGDLQLMEKNMAVKKFGKITVFNWRRGYLDRPPGGESLKDVHDRVVSFFNRKIKPKCAKGETIIIVSHGNTLRAIIKHLEKINNELISAIDLPYAHPIVYKFRKGSFIKTEGEYRFTRPLR